MTPKISVFLPSYNKGEYVLDAMRAVFAQTRDDWELWILENSNDGRTNLIVEDELTRHFGLQECDEEEFLDVLGANGVHYVRLEGEEIERQRREKYITAWLLNVYYPEANGEYIFYISDDDLIDPECFEVMARELDANLNYYVVYAGLRVSHPFKPGEVGEFSAELAAKDIKSFPGTADCKMDGGQVMHRKTCLDALVPPYFEEINLGHVANHVDGIFLERLVGRFTFYPIDRYLITHRRTKISLWTRTVDATPQD